MFRSRWRPAVLGYAHSEAEAFAPRDGGWVELWSTDGDRRYGRGHLMLWPAEATPPPGDEVAPTEGVDQDAAQPVGEGGPNLRAELRGFTFDGPPPDVGSDLMVRPEKEQDSYMVRVMEVDSDEPKSGRVGLDWPDDRLPSSLSELGGY